MRTARFLLPLALLALPLLAPAVSAAEGARASSRVLVRYSFDDSDLASGPDTFAVYERSRGQVRLVRELRFSGYRSVEIRDQAGDGDFPELQGYFDLRHRGKLYLGFALLTAEPAETFNLALAGPAGFALQPDGIAFWLQARGGSLYHVSDSMPKRLLELAPFVWYAVEVAYDIEAGTYGLAIRQEGLREPVVELQAQPNATRAPGSAVDKFSFIGDTGEDTSNAVYYVDDVVLSADRPVALAAFVAPGRRKLFIDAWHERRKLARKSPDCLPTVELADLGVDLELRGARPDERTLRLLEAALGGVTSEAHPTDAVPEEWRRFLEGAALRQRGCAALARGKAAEALELFDAAVRSVPESPLYGLSAVLALVRLERLEEAELRLARIEPAARNDLPYAHAAALLGLARDDLDEAERWLEDHEALAEQLLFVLLWKGSFARAERHAADLADDLEAAGRPSALWLERAGDAAFLSGDAAGALRWYLKSAELAPASALLSTKLSDVHFVLGDLERERLAREAVYGSLSEEGP